MNNSLVKIKFEFPDLLGRYKKAQPRLERLLVSELQKNRGKLFDSEGARNGHKKWAPLKCRTGQILSLRGDLRKSIAPRGISGKPGPGGVAKASGGTRSKTAVVGSKLIYAGVQNYGAVIRAKKAQVLRFKSFGKVVYRQSVEIPARNFTDMTPQDVREIAIAITNFVTKVLNGG